MLVQEQLGYVLTLQQSDLSKNILSLTPLRINVLTLQQSDLSKNNRGGLPECPLVLTLQQSDLSKNYEAKQ